MGLDEAFKLLNNAGLIAEDTETNDDEYDDADAEYRRLIRNPHHYWIDTPQKKAAIQRKYDALDRHMDLDTKIKNAKRFNRNGPAFGMGLLREMIDGLNKKFHTWSFELEDVDDNKVRIYAQYTSNGNKQIEEFTWDWYPEDAFVRAFGHKEGSDPKSKGNRDFEDIPDIDALKALIIKDIKNA